MKYLLYRILPALFLITTVACSEEAIFKNKDQSKSDTSDSDESKEVDHPSQLAYEFIQKNLTLSLKKSEVTGLLGTNFIEIVSKDGESWRYNIGATNYHSAKVDDVSEADFHAIKGEKINAILFIHWKNELVDRYTIYYYDQTLNKVKAHEISN
jgi:hypothetical protein